MMNRSLATAFLLVILYSLTFAQPIQMRSGVFLHHSTGGCIWGPNGSPTSVPQELITYNTAHGLSGSNVVSLVEEGWPVNPWDNEWYRWHRIFDNQDPEADIRPYLLNNRIIVIKSCFPSSSMSGVGQPGDTLAPTVKSLYNYKWHWRDFVGVMRQHPDNFFVVWTNAPLVASQTSAGQAALSSAFCTWAKDTLARGLDPVFGQFPQNVAVFDFFHKLTGSEGMLLPIYAASSTDSHPNAAATSLIAPQFVQELFDASIAYELTLSVTQPQQPWGFSLEQNFPNPFNPATNVRFTIGNSQLITIRIYDLLGRETTTLVNEVKHPGTYAIRWDATGVASGTYLCRMMTGGFITTRKFILAR